MERFFTSMMYIDTALSRDTYANLIQRQIIMCNKKTTPMCK